METNYVVHAGLMLKDNLASMGMSQKELSEATGVSTTVINEIIKGKRKISIDTAKKFEGVFGLPAKYWLDIQTDYELAKDKKEVVKITENECVNSGYSVYEIADRIVFYENSLAENEEYYERSLTPLKLQKILFFEWKEFLKEDIVLFPEPIKHWVYGPVVAEIYAKYKNKRDLIIEPVEDKPLSAEYEKTLKAVFMKYNKYTASYLVSLTHKEDVWKNTEKDQIITPEMMLASLAEN